MPVEVGQRSTSGSPREPRYERCLREPERLENDADREQQRVLRRRAERVEGGQAAVEEVAAPAQRGQRVVRRVGRIALVEREPERGEQPHAAHEQAALPRAGRCDEGHGDKTRAGARW